MECTLSPPNPNDPISAALRAAEHEIDNHYRSNALVTRPRDEASWYFLAFCEDRALREVYWMLQGTARTPHEQTAFADNLVLHAKRPLAWIHRDAPAGGPIPRTVDGAVYAATRGFSDLSTEYLGFEAAFTFASSSRLSLELEGHTIHASGSLKSDTRFEAYDRLVRQHATLPDAAEAYLTELVASVRVKGGSFKYRLSPGAIRDGIEVLGPAFDARLKLPTSWEFPDFTVAQFGDVARVLFVLGTIHFHARIAAAYNGCKGLGITHALLLWARDELFRRLTRYSGAPEGVVTAIVETLTYGARDQRTPDPALQPLLRLSDGAYLTSPNLIMNSSMERNLTVLLNRLSPEQRTYSRLSRDREHLCREALKGRLSSRGFRFWHGDVTGWNSSSDIDLAIVSDAERSCLLLELKAFIDPAEPREIMERSEEIARGVAQVRDRRTSARNSAGPLLRALGIDDRYALTWAVASETSVGAVYVQAPDVPVVNARHLAERLSRESLPNTCSWLDSRAYLPVDGVHYDTVPVLRTVGAWTLEWYGVRGRIDDFAEQT